MPLKLLRRLPRPSLSTVLISLVAGGLIHIAATLAVPHVAPGNAMTLIKRTAAANQMRILPRARPDTQAFPYMAPDVRYAVCPFDISEGTLQVAAELPEQGWSLALYSDQGDSFFSVVAPEQRSAEVAFTVQFVRKSIWSFLSSTRAVAVDTSLVLSPHPTGLVVVRAPLRGQAYSAAVEASLKKASCALKAQ